MRFSSEQSVPGEQSASGEQSPSASAPPDLITFAVIHRVMREDGRRFADAVARVTEPHRIARVAPLARWYAGYCGELHDHHVIEDQIFLPALVERVPEAAALVARIDTDHEHLSDLIERITAALDRLADVSVAFRPAHAEAVMLTDGLAALLESHLAFEEDDVLPLVEANFTGEEYEALEKQARQRPALRRTVFTVPWVLEGATDEERRHLLGAAPFPFRLLWLASRGRYRRLATAAFDSFDAEPAAPGSVAV